MIDSGLIYLVVRDFEKSLAFYSELLEREVSARNKTRFAMFYVGDLCLCLLNARYDMDHSDEVERVGEYHPLFDDFAAIAEWPNSRKAVINLVTSDLKSEYERVKELGIGSDLTDIRYINAGAPYYYFCLCDPDGNVVEITGEYRHVKGHF